MKASKLTLRLQTLVATYGDLPVYVTNYGGKLNCIVNLDYDVKSVNYAQGGGTPFLGRRKPGRFVLGEDDGALCI